MEQTIINNTKENLNQQFGQKLLRREVFGLNKMKLYAKLKNYFSLNVPYKY